MKNAFRRICFACIALAVTTPLGATERSHTSTLKFVYPLANGDFVIGFDAESAFCTSASTPNKYYGVYVGQNGVAAAGASKMFAAALLALSTRQSVSIAFDDATANCYVNRLTVSN
jgi:hypothetical protein